MSFWVRLIQLIIVTTTLVEVEKFNYLKPLVEGKASNIIAYDLNQNDWISTWEIWAKPQDSLVLYARAISFPTSKNNLTIMRHFLDQMETYVRGLESFGQRHFFFLALYL